MKVTILLSRDNYSGGVRVVGHLADWLVRHGHQVEFVSRPRPEMSWPGWVKSWMRGQPPQRASSASHLDRFEVAHRVIDSYRPVEDRDVADADVVMATWWETAEWAAGLSPTKGRKAYFIQQYEVASGSPPDRVDATWKLPMAKIVCSQWLADFGRTKFGEEVAAVIPNGVDVDLFHAPPREKGAAPVVGMLYSHAAVKNCQMTLRALERARRVIPGLRVVSFGTDHPDGTVPLPAYAEYEKTPPQERLRELYAKCDLWVCGSNSEGFHLPPHEAMACRCPVVSTRVGGPVDLVRDGENGFLVDVGDESAMVDRVVEVLSAAPARWREMSDAAFAAARSFDWDRAGRSFEAVLQKIV